MKYLNRFLWWCAGANISILEKCPTDQSKYFGLGGTIFFTALMASFAGGYAFFSAFKTVPLSFLFGGFWGLLIFNLDRFIVSSTGKGDGTVKITKEEWMNALPRLVLAIIIGFVVAVPLELKVFEREINVEIQKMINEERHNIIEGLSDLRIKIQSLRDTKIDLDNELQRIATILESGDDVIVSMSDEEIMELEERKIDVISELKQAEKDYGRGWVKYDQNDKILASINSSNQKFFTPTPTIDGYKKEKAIGLAIMNKYRPIRDELRIELKELQLKLKETSSEKTTRIEKLKTDFEIEQSKIKNQKIKLDKEIEELEKRLAAKEKEADDTSIQFDGLMAQLIAIDRLGEKVDTIYKTNSVARIPNNSDSLGVVTMAPSREILRVDKSKTPVHYAQWMISILLISIEIAPILFKMMTESGPYDDRLEEIRYKSELDKRKYVSDVNGEVNIKLRLEQAINDNKLKAELLANKELLNAIATAQSDIVKIAIEEWKKEQMDKVKQQPNLIIKSDIKTTSQLPMSNK